MKAVSENNGTILDNSEDVEKPPLDSVDDKKQIINAIGEWGPWQRRSFTLVLLFIWTPASFHLLNMVFFRAETDFWCVKPSYVDSKDAWVNITSLSKSDGELDQCEIKDLGYSNISTWADLLMEEERWKNDGTNKTMKCQHWEYDRSFWKRTLIQDFDLVCDRAWLKKLQQQITFMGLLGGVFFSGILSDRFGRRKTMVVFLLTTVLFGTISSFAPNYIFFLFCTFVCGFSSIAYGTVMYVWMLELVVGKQKTILGCAPHYNFAIWGLSVALISYLVPNWSHLQLIFSLPLLVLLIGYWILPESPRWLLTNGRVKEAEDIVRNIALYNNKPLPKDFVLHPPKTAPTGKGIFGFSHLFRTPNLCRNTLIVYYMWFSTALIYYGLTLNSNKLGGGKSSLFIYFSLGKTLEFPAISIVIFLLLRGGRRATIISFYSLAGICLILTFFIPMGYFKYEWPIMALNIAGRFGAVGTLCLCYIYSAEIFPTIVRNAGVGTSSVWARVGPMVAPFVADLAIHDKRLPMVVFGLAALVAAFLASFLPETANSHMPDTIQEAEILGSGDNLWKTLCGKKKKETTTTITANGCTETTGL